MKLPHSSFRTMLALMLAGPVTAVWAQSLPQVTLNADDLRPRPIEQLTGTNITRHYALAWRDMADALDSNRSNLLSGEFTGFALDQLRHRISDQQQTGVHAHIVDHGHRLKAVFYSLDGGAMQLIDEAQIEIQVFDGSHLISTENSPHKYVVLMTPGADRWYVRSLDSLP